MSTENTPFAIVVVTSGRTLVLVMVGPVTAFFVVDGVAFVVVVVVEPVLPILDVVVVLTVEVFSATVVLCQVKINLLIA